MIIKIQEAESLAKSALTKLGFGDESSNLIIKNLLEAELADKKTHGLIRIPALKKQIDSGKINVSESPLDVISETSFSIHFDGDYKSGFIVIYQSLEKAIKKAKQSGMVSVGLKDLSYASGFMGAYARVATENDLIFIGFSNSAGGLIPHGAKKELWGTNPITIAVPTNTDPVILDMASSMTTWGSLMVSKQEGKPLPNGVALDAEGEITTDPEKAMEGGLLPFAGHKGSGLAFIVELLAGALTGSRVGYSVEGGWGTFYILLDPKIFRPLADFKADISKAIEELKNAPKANGVNEIYYAGEQSNKLRSSHLQSGEIEVSDKLLAELKNISRDT
jgi:L-2-hydroxycarboxylate dehydrogenase (NAD+)